MKENPKYLPFLRDLARQSWPDYDATRLVLADRLEEEDDPRSAKVRAAVPDVWRGGSWRNASLIDPSEKALFKGACVSPRSRYQALQHFQTMLRVLVDGNNHKGYKARLQVAMFSLWVPFAPHEPDYCWKDVTLLVGAGGDWNFVTGEARKVVTRFPEEDWELVLRRVGYPEESH